MSPSASSHSVPGSDQLVQRHDQGRVGADAQVAVDLGRPSREHAHAVTRPRLGDVPLGPPRLLLRQPAAPRPRAGPGPAAARRRHGRTTRRAFPRRAVRRIWSRYARAHSSTIARRSARAEAAVAPADLEARREPLHVPFPRAGVGLVEVVDVEEHPPLGRREHAEVRHVGVAAELDGHAGHRRAGQVAGHDRGGAAVEGERRDGHAGVAHRHELGHAVAVLALEQRDRVGPAGRRLPRPVSRTRRGGARGPSPRDPLLRRQPPPSPFGREAPFESLRHARIVRLRVAPSPVIRAA